MPKPRSVSEPLELKATKVEPRKSPDFQSVYSNHAEAGFSRFDAYIDFGELSAGGDHWKDSYIDMKIRIVMALPHMKQLSQVLTESIAKFEREFGEITVLNLEKPLSKGK